MNPAALTLITLAREVRSRTIRSLERVHPDALTWTPKGTVNHTIWHAGHILWGHDVLCIAPLAGQPQLPDSWSARFGMESNPATDRQPWPSRESLLDLLRTQLKTSESLISSADPAILAQMSIVDDHTSATGWGIVHALHDEAIHQGEMFLLRKLWLAANPNAKIT